MSEFDSFVKKAGRKPLYKDPRNKKICGICSGVADYFGYETWIVRLAAVCLLCIFQSPVLFGYFILYLILDNKPSGMWDHVDHDEKPTVEAWKKKRNKKTSAKTPLHTDDEASMSMAHKLYQLKPRFARMEKRLQRMESYITSAAFQIHTQLKDAK